MDVSIGEVKLAVRAARASTATSRDACERFARRVLEAVSDAWAARWPEHVIFVRELAVNWRLSANDLDGEDRIAAAAAEVMSTVEDLIRDADQRPSPNAGVVSFTDRGAYLLAYWEAMIDGSVGDCWWLEDAAALDTAESAEVIRGALVAAWQNDRLAAILAGLPARWRERIAVVARASDVLIDHPLAPQETRSLAVQLIPPSQLLDPAAASIWFAVAASRVLPHSSTGEEIELASVAYAQWSRALPRASTAGEPAIVDSFGDSAVTELGGVVFLLSLAMELDLGNALWEACLPEGPLVGAAIANLVEDESATDPLLRAIAGDWEGEVHVETGQQEEVAVVLLREFIRASTRRGAALPQVRLRLWHRLHDRFLVACAADEFPCFVWQADSAAGLARGLALFLHEWPCRSVRPEGAPGLAAVDHAGRVRASFDNGTGPSPFLPTTPSETVAALTTQIGGTLGALWSARLRLERTLERAEFVERYIRLPGRVRVGAERVDVILPMDRTDLDVRRAGLDRSPGWIPWLRKTVSVEFKDGNGAA